MKKILCSRLLVFFVLALVGITVYANAIGHPFVHDDVAFIEQNPNIGRWDNVGDLFLKPVWSSEGQVIRDPYYRPLLEVVYRLEFKFFGMDPAGFHFFNIVLHIINAFLVFLLGICLRMPRLWSFVVAVVFLVHPVQSEAVACVAGVSNLVVTLFCLGTFLAYVQSRQSSMLGMMRWSGLAVIFFVLGLLSKEQAVVVPVLILMYEFIWRKEIVWVFSRWALLAVLFWILAAYLAWRQVVLPGMMGGVWADPGELVLRLTSIPRMLLDHLEAIFSPVNLHYYRSVDILAPKLIPALWFVSVMCWMLAFVFVFQGRMGRWVRLGLLWFFIALVPALNILPLINEYSLVMASDHFLYLPLVGILFFCVPVIGWMWRILRGQISLGFFRVIVVSILVVLAAMAVRQNMFWRGEIPLFERTLVFQTGFGRGHLLLAAAYAKAGQYPQALEEYARGLRIMGDYVKKARLPEARNVYFGYIEQAHFERGECYRKMGLWREANTEYFSALAVHSGARNSHELKSRASTHAALNLLQMGDRVLAKKFLEEAVKLDPQSVEAMNNLGVFSLENGQRAVAVFWFERAVKKNPLFSAAWANLRRIQNF